MSLKLEVVASGVLTCAHLLTRAAVTRVAAAVALASLFAAPFACVPREDGCTEGFWICEGAQALDVEDRDDDGIANDYDCAERDPQVGALYIARDEDGDGVAGTEAFGPAIHCEIPDGYSDVLGDCDDTDPAKISVDIYFVDLDADGYGVGEGEALCASDVGYALQGGDCDDAAADIHPGEVELPDDGIDNDCDGQADDAPPEGTFSASDGEFSLTGTGDDELSASLGEVGDLDGLGAAELAVGSPGVEDADGKAVGAVDVYGGPLLSDAEAGARVATRLWGGHDGDRAGEALAGLGDLDGDGYADMVVGAPGVESSGSGGGGYGTGTTGPEGAAYVVYGPIAPGSAVQLEDSRHVAMLGASGIAGRLGTAVASLGDYTGDGLPDLAVSAPYLGGRTSDIPTEGGRIYLLEDVPDQEQAVGEVAFASLSGEEEYGRLGATLAGGKDLDGDGTVDLVVGAPTDRVEGRVPGATASNETTAGVAWILLEPILGDATISSRASTSLTGPTDSALGSSIGLLSDVDGDGCADLALGASFDSGGADQGGAVYLLSGAALHGLPAGEVTSSDALLSVLYGTDATDYLGWAVADGGDVDGDGLSDLLVGAPGRSDGHGAAYLLTDPVGSPDLSDARITIEGPFAKEWIGRSLASADLNGLGRSDLIIGAVEDGVGFDDPVLPGHLFLFFTDAL